jgi:hypothetical protein
MYSMLQPAGHLIGWTAEPNRLRAIIANAVRVRTWPGASSEVAAYRLV